MKKILLSLISIFAMAAGSSAMSLKEAFTALSNLPDVSVRAPDYNLPVINDFIQNGQIAAAYNLDRQHIYDTGNAAYTILNQIPLSYMINGGNNHYVMAFVYATPNETGSNDILIAVMSGFKGSVVFIYGTTDNICKEAIQNAPLQMQGNYLSIVADSIPDIGDFNILINKAR